MDINTRRFEFDLQLGCEEEKEATGAQEKSLRLLAGRTVAARMDQAATLKGIH